MKNSLWNNTDAVLPLRGLATHAVEMLDAQHKVGPRLWHGTKIFPEDLADENKKLSARSLGVLLANAHNLWAHPGFSFELATASYPSVTAHPLVSHTEHATNIGTFLSAHGAFQASASDEWLITSAVLLSEWCGAKHRPTFFFQMPEPSYFELFDVFIQGECVFGAPLAGVLVPAGSLNETGPSTEAPFIAWARKTLNVNPRLTQSSLAEQSRMSLASIKRRYRQHSSSFQRQLDDILKTKALVQLYIERQPLETVRLNLGYADTRSFRRSFRRWTGDTPMKYMNKHQPIRTYC